VRRQVGFSIVTQARSNGAQLISQVVELEMQLDEIREQYKLIARSTNSKAQARKLEFMQHNLEQLNIVQKQVRRPA
jgi:outer membrane murein-binding lipoprotein Lpp